MTYSLTRFAIYETVRDSLSQGAQGPLPFYQKVLLGAVGGELGFGKYRRMDEVRSGWVVIFHLLSSGCRIYWWIRGDPG